MYETFFTSYHNVGIGPGSSGTEDARRVCRHARQRVGHHDEKQPSGLYRLHRKRHGGQSAQPFRRFQRVESVDGGLSRLATDAELPGGDEAFAGRRYAELYLRGAYLFRAGNRDEGHPLRAGLERVAGREVDTLSRVCRFLGNE